MRPVAVILALVAASLTVAAQNATRVSPTVAIHTVDPEYSPEARAANYEGTLTVYVEVDASGRAQQVRVIQGLGLGLDEKAVEAVRQWIFEPATLNGAPLRTAQGVELHFRLNPASDLRVRHTAFVVKPNGKSLGISEKPVLTNYFRPDAGVCAAIGVQLIPVNLSVDEKGVPQNVQILAMPSGKNGQLLLDAVKQWRFKPARSNGKTTSATASFTFECGPESLAETAPAVRVGNGVSAPTRLSNPEPLYSEEARQAKYEGNTAISLEIDSNGFATRLRIDHLIGLGLDANAMEAVKQWRFRPAMKAGQPVPVQAIIEVNFRLI